MANRREPKQRRDDSEIRADLAALEEDAEVRMHVAAKQWIARRRLLADCAAKDAEIEALRTALNEHQTGRAPRRADDVTVTA